MAAERIGAACAADRRLPLGMRPRLLSRDVAAAYCGVVGETFDQHIRPHVPPIQIGTRRLWDIRALDRWLDERSGLIAELRPIDDWLSRLDYEATATANDARPRRQ